MRKLTLMLLALLLCASFAAAEPARTAEEGAHVVGVDLIPGQYVLTGEGEAVLLDWDGSEVYRGGADTLRLYNEQTLTLSKGMKAEFVMAFASSEYDTGTRQVDVSGPGTYPAGTLLDPGLYMVEAMEDPDEPLRLTGSQNRSFTLQKGACYTVYLAEGATLELPQGCMLRSMVTHLLFQEDAPVYVQQARYHVNMQMPGFQYTITGGKGGGRVETTIPGGETRVWELYEGEAMALDPWSLGSELLVELVNCTVAHESGEG